MTGEPRSIPPANGMSQLCMFVFNFECSRPLNLGMDSVWKRMTKKN